MSSDIGLGMRDVGHLDQIFIKKLTASPAECDTPKLLNEKIQKLIALYLSSSQRDSEFTVRFETLSRDLNSRTLSEVARKYSLQEMASTQNPFYNSIVSLLQSPDLDHLKQKEVESLPEKITEEQFKWAPVKRDEMLRILIQAKVQKRKCNGQTFDCHVIEERELTDWIADKVMHLTAEEVHRFQLLVRNDVHYTALDFELKGGILSCCILDAAQDPKYESLVEKLLERNVRVFVAGGCEEQKIQYDFRSCSIFALDHLTHTTKDSSFFDFLETNSISIAGKGYKIIAWETLPPSLVKNAQSREFFARYFSLNPQYEREIYKACQTFKQYIENNFNPLASQVSEQNLGICRKLEKYKSRVRRYFQASTLSDIGNIAFKC